MRGPGVTDTAIMRTLIEGADLVIGIYPDKTKPYGVAQHVIKGHRLLMTVVAEKKNSSVRLECLALRCLEEAIAIQQVLGEARPLN